MNKSNVLTTTFKTAALVGAFSLFSAVSSHAAFQPLGFPTPEGTAGTLSALPIAPVGTLAPGGFLSTSYSDSFGFSGTLNTYVIQTSPGGPLDFYYQLVNTTPGPDGIVGDEQISRLSVQGGFLGAVMVAQTNLNPTTLAALAGTVKIANSADRGEPLVTNGNLGFTFPVGAATYTSNLGNVASGQQSNFLVVRTTSTTFTGATARIGVNGGNQDVGTFAPVPEPSSILFGLGMFGVALTSRAKRRAAK